MNAVLVPGRDCVPQIVSEEHLVSAFQSNNSTDNLQKAKQYVPFNVPEDTNDAYKDFFKKVFKQLYEIKFQKHVVASLMDCHACGFTV